MNDIIARNKKAYDDFMAGVTPDYKPEALAGTISDLWSLPVEELKQVLAESSLYKKDNILVGRQLAESIDFSRPLPIDILNVMPNYGLSEIEKNITDRKLHNSEAHEFKNCLQILESIAEIKYKRQQVISASVEDTFEAVLLENIDFVEPIKTDILYMILKVKSDANMKILADNLFIKEFEPQAFYKSFTELARSDNNLEYLHQHLAPAQWAVMEAFYKPYMFADYLATQEKKSYICNGLFYNTNYPEDSELFENALIQSYNLDNVTEFNSIVKIPPKNVKLALFKMIYKNPEYLLSYIEDYPDFMSYIINTSAVGIKSPYTRTLFTLDVITACLTSEMDLHNFIEKIPTLTQKKLEDAIITTSHGTNKHNLAAMVAQTDVQDAKKIINVIHYHSTGLGPTPDDVQKIIDYVIIKYMKEDYIKDPDSVPYLTVEVRKILDIMKEKDILENIQSTSSSKGFKI